MKGSFLIGDAVEVIDDQMQGIVVAIAGESITIETEDGFKISFNKRELVKHNKGIKYHFKGAVNKQLEFQEEQQKIAKRQASRPKAKTAPPMEVDLHIEKLEKHYKRLSNFEILNMQMEHAKHKMEFALQKKIQRVVFIHGVGQGVLKEELHYLFKNYEGIRVKPADYQKYGQGATMVYFTQKATRV